MSQGRFWKIDTPKQVDERIEYLAAWLRELPADQFPIVITPTKYSPQRSLSQNALYHVWVRKLCQETMGWGKPTKEQEKAMGYTLIRHCYADKAWPFLMTKNMDLLTGEERPAPAAISDLSKAEMAQFMDWVQYFGATKGVMLESRGEFQDYKEAQDGV